MELLTAITHENTPLFIWEGGFETKDIPKQAKFWWHGGGCWENCAACAAGIGRKWWSPKTAYAARLVDYADAKAKEALGEHLATVEASKAADADIEVPAPEGLSYLPYQRAGIAYALGRDGTLIADEMGLGKTIQALGYINARKDIKKVLVICPASLRLNWEREAKKWLVGDFDFFVMENSSAPKFGENFVITNFAKFAGPNAKKVVGYCMSQDWDLVIIDEAHNLKNNSSQRAKAILGYWHRKKKENIPGVISKAKAKLFLTGTPILNAPIEAQPLLGALNHKEFGYYFSFAKRYANAHHNGWGWDFSGACNLEELQERARSICMIRRLKKDVLKELPPKFRQIVELPVDSESREVLARETNELANRSKILAAMQQREVPNNQSYTESVSALENNSQILFTEMARFRREVSLAKLPTAIEHIDAVLENVDKVVLFAHHRAVIERLQDHYSESCVVITGATPMHARQQAVDDFQTREDKRVFIGNIKAAGVGLTLTAASTVIFVELDWVPANLTQAEDRCYRYGQQDSVLVQHLVLAGSLDAKMAKSVVEKQAVADQALDNDHRIHTPIVEVPAPPPTPARPSVIVESTVWDSKPTNEPEDTIFIHAPVADNFSPTVVPF